MSTDDRPIPPAPLLLAVQDRFIDHLRAEPSTASADTVLGEACKVVGDVAWPSADDGPPGGERYNFGDVFASGGLGLVRRAYDRRLNRTVAVKELQRSDPEAVRRFMREATITARLQHPAIIPLYDFGRHRGGEPYYCMKMIEGTSLDQMIAARPTLQARVFLVEHMRAAADAIAYAHRHGVIHRDLKPANILVGELGETVVIDWGLAKDLSGAETDSDRARTTHPEIDDALTKTGAVMGTLRYMPPEQARGEAVDARSDVFALGAALFHILVGTPPYAGAQGMELMQRVADCEIEDVREMVPQVPELAAITRKAMALRPEDRYPSAEEFADDLRRYLGGLLVGAHHYSAGQVLGRWLRRHKALAAVSATAIVALTVGGVIAVDNIAVERDQAEIQRARAEDALVTAQRRADEALVAQAQAILPKDTSRALAALAQLELVDETTIRRARLVGLAAGARGIPKTILKGHRWVISGIAPLPDGGLVSIDVGGAVWRWDPRTETGQEVLRVEGPDVQLISAHDAPVWAVINPREVVVLRGDAEVQRIDLLDLPEHHRSSYRWELAADGSALAALGKSMKLTGVDPGAPVYRWDLRTSPATRIQAPGLRGYDVADGDRVLSVAYSATGPDQIRRVMYMVEGKTIELMGARAKSILGLSPSGRFVVAEATDCILEIIPIDGSPARRTTPPSWRACVGDGKTAQIVELTNDDHALVVWGAGSMLILESSSLITGEIRWSHMFSGRQPGTWGGSDHASFTNEILVDSTGHYLAIRDHERWMLGSARTGELPRIIEVGPHTAALWLSTGHFATARGDAISIWSPSLSVENADLVEIAAAGDYTFTVASDRVTRRRGPGESHGMEIECDSRLLRPPRKGTPWFRSGHRPPSSDVVAVNSGGRMIWAASDGWACVSDPGGDARIIHTIDGTAKARISAVGSFALANDNGEVQVWKDVGETPQEWHLMPYVWDMIADPVGQGFIVISKQGQVLLLHTDGGSEELLPASTNAVRSGVRTTAAAFSPDGTEIALQVGGEDRFIRINTQTGERMEKGLNAPARPALAYSPKGERLGLAAGNSGLLILEDSLQREIALARVPTRIAWIDEDHLAMLDDRGHVALVDVVLGEAVELTTVSKWGSLKALPDALVVEYELRHRLTLEDVPDDAVTLHAWFLEHSDLSHR